MVARVRDGPVNSCRRSVFCSVKSGMLGALSPESDHDHH